METDIAGGELLCRLSFKAAFSDSEPLSARARQVAAMFGLPIRQPPPRTVWPPISLTIRRGQLIFLTGPSGSGKTVLLRQLQTRLPGALQLASVRPEPDRPLVDCFELPLSQTLHLLSHAGLGEPRVLLQSSRHLSEGQRYRLRLALALAASPSLLLADEFCAVLDRVTARAIAHNLRKATRRWKQAAVVASAHDDLLEDLDPDVLIHKSFGPDFQVRYRCPAA